MQLDGHMRKKLKELELPLAEEKEAVISSSARLHEEFLRRTGRTKQTHEFEALKLGVDTCLSQEAFVPREPQAEASTGEVAGSAQDEGGAATAKAKAKPKAKTQQKPKRQPKKPKRNSRIKTFNKKLRTAGKHSLNASVVTAKKMRK